MNSKKKLIFISYSHHDKKWFNEDNALFDLIPFLKRSLGNLNVTFWYDRDKKEGIEAGEAFKSKIENRIDAADIAILMISQEFLNSKFIAEVELQRIQDRYEEKQLQVFPILLEPCDWEEIAFISKLQIVPGKPTPLIEFTDNERNWVYARQEILQSLKKKIISIAKGVTISGPNQGPDTWEEKTKYVKVRSRLFLLFTIPIIIGCIIAIIFFAKHSQSISKNQGIIDTDTIAEPPMITSNGSNDSVEKKTDIPNGVSPGNIKDPSKDIITISEGITGTGDGPVIIKDPKPENTNTGNISNKPAYGSFMDPRDRQEYKWVKIGNQMWMAENLNYTTTEGSWCYDDRIDNCKKYGRLYNWETARDACPSGWRLPGDSDWNTLMEYLGGETVAGSKMRSSSVQNKYKDISTNNYGFNAFLAGYRGCYAKSDCEGFHNMNKLGYWWSATDYNELKATYWFLRNDNSKLYHLVQQEKTTGVSVRCIKK